MKIRDQIRIMEGYLTGDRILFFDLDDNRTSTKWIEIAPNQQEYFFDFENFDYKIKPKELTLEEKVKAEYGEYEVVMFGYDSPCADNMQMWTFINKRHGCSHVLAQSVKGFSGYVYDNGKGGFEVWADSAISRNKEGMDIMFLPIAVLFTKDSK